MPTPIGEKMEIWVRVRVRMTPSDVKVTVHEGGTVWSGAAVAVAVFGYIRLYSLIPAVLEWFLSEDCLPVTDNPLTLSQVGVLVAAGFASVALAEYGTRRAGNRWIGMVASVLGVVLVLAAVGLATTLATPSLSCGA